MTRHPFLQYGCAIWSPRGSDESRIIVLPERSSICQYRTKMSAIIVKNNQEHVYFGPPCIVHFKSIKNVLCNNKSFLFVTGFVNWMSNLVHFQQRLPKYESRLKQGSRRVKNGSRRGDPNLSYAFSSSPLLVVVCLCRSLLEKRVDCWHWKRTQQVTAKNYYPYYH